MKSLLPVLLLAAFLPEANCQDTILHRLIFIGETGAKFTSEPNSVFGQAAGDVFAGRTTVFYLDDIDYLLGKERAGSRGERMTKGQLQSQFQLMKAKGARVYFVAANPAWNKIGIEGLKNFNNNVQAEADSLVRQSPGKICPDPVEMELSENVSLIVFNSEWWLYPYEYAIDDSCECKSKSEVLARLDEIRFKNIDKTILMVSHHPFQSYGVYGSRGTLTDHLFPLTAANKNLYIPLPLAGSLFRFFRSSFVSPGHGKHPLNKDMVSSVGELFEDLPNVIHISGHEKGLQFIRDEHAQAVVGPAATHIKARKGKHSLFANTGAGYLVVDLMRDQKLRFNFYRQNKDDQPAFSYQQNYLAAVIEDTAGTGYISGDSITVQIHPSYDEVGGLRRMFFGENYRKEWAAPTTLPVLRLSKIRGGLTPLKRGGGMQSKSLRLADKDGKEWVIRSVEKSPDALLPDNFRRTFARDWVDDATSAQHPFGALVVPPIAHAVNVPHANPVIGVVAPDKSLGIHGRVFSNEVVLFEEREPMGDSDNSAKMKENLLEDNDNKIEAKAFLNARMLDMLLGDWDRHEDQWRWKDKAKGKTKLYLGIPRDRDQVFHVTEGLIPKIASKEYVLPTLRDFDSRIEDVEWVLFKTRFVNAYPEFQLSREEWTEQAEKFKAAVTDSVLETALKRLPKPAYDLRHGVLLKNLKARRDRVPYAMDRYYRFIQKIVDIQTSDKDEWIQIKDAANGGLNIRIAKISKSGKIEDELMNKTYDPGLTKEVRLYMRNGNDSILLNSGASRIRLRIIGGSDRKSYTIESAKHSTILYDRPNGSAFYGNARAIRKRISNDSLHTAFVPVNLYNTWMPLVLVGLNLDDGFIIGAGFRFMKQEGFRKLPYAHLQQVLAGYSFSTGAYRIRYNGEWIHAFGKGDFTMQLFARAPNNTINFFGRGNETEFDKTGDFKRFYRTRFSTYQFDPALRWRKNYSAFSIGPSLYYYAFERSENEGRFITHTSLVGSYDSSTLEKSKLHLGVALQFARDSRNNRIFPQWGSFINVRLQAYRGMGDYAKSFAQLIPEFAFYKSLTRRSTIVLAERMGGVIGMGNAAFYQSAFIGGHENLFGYRQYRFAGHHSFYNNLELRVRLADFASYILPGQFGITGFWDIGRVWEKHDNSGKWHNGVGGGIYFAPASVMALSIVMGYSNEGFYPYFTMGLRF